jgi:hypothetical protein
MYEMVVVKLTYSLLFSPAFPILPLALHFLFEGMLSVVAVHLFSAFVIPVPV